MDCQNERTNKTIIRVLGKISTLCLSTHPTLCLSTHPAKSGGGAGGWLNGACGLQLPDNHNESGGQGRAKPVLFSLALCDFVVIFAPQKITGKRYGANGKRGTAQKAAGRQRRTASAGSDSDQARAPPPKGARKPEGRRPAKPREKRAAIAGPRRGGPGPGERRESAKRKKGKGGEAGRSLYPCPFVERSAMPGGCRAEETESAARGKSRTRSGG